MGDETNISWCNRTWSPWGGCQAVSPACDHCYAEALDARYGHADRWGPHGSRQERAAAYYRQPLRWNALAQAAGVRDSAFPSMCDPFDNHRSIKLEWRERFWEIIRATPCIDWLLLTKRPQNIAKMLPADWGDGYPNVWLGTTVENQEEADRRIPHLLEVPAVVRFLSCEPLLGPVDLTPVADEIYQKLSEWYGPEGFDPTGSQPKVTRRRGWFPKVHWVICGGESGSNARPMHPDWARSLRDQCAAAGVSFHFKQWGEWLPGTQYNDACRKADPSDTQSRFDCMDIDDDTGQYGEASSFWADDPSEHAVYRVGARRAGNLFDGRQYLEFQRAALASDAASDGV